MDEVSGTEPSLHTRVTQQGGTKQVSPLTCQMETPRLSDSLKTPRAQPLGSEETPRLSIFRSPGECLGVCLSALISRGFLESLECLALASAGTPRKVQLAFL